MNHLTRFISTANPGITIMACGERGSGGANHFYIIRAGDEFGRLEFQRGGILEAGINGITNESLLAVVIDRLEGFQSGNFACRENAIALTRIQEALMWLNKRTADRLARGVEGKEEK